MIFDLGVREQQKVENRCTNLMVKSKIKFKLRSEIFYFAIVILLTFQNLSGLEKKPEKVINDIYQILKV
jgi:hypothetical protein